jgi:uncharacterized membrane protein
MQTLTLYATTAALFLAIDAVMLRMVMKPLFSQYLGEALLDSPRLGPAALFYLFYVFGLLVLVSVPAMNDGDAFRALWQGALLGAVAYGTYEMTNFATLKDWHWQMVATDWAWGTVLTGGTAWLGVVITRAIFSQ